MPTNDDIIAALKQQSFNPSQPVGSQPIAQGPFHSDEGAQGAPGSYPNRNFLLNNSTNVFNANNPGTISQGFPYPSGMMNTPGYTGTNSSPIWSMSMPSSGNTFGQ